MILRSLAVDNPRTDVATVHGHTVNRKKGGKILIGDHHHY